MALKLRLSRWAVLASLLLPATQAAMAARQCLALPGAYGAVTVSGCENDLANGVVNPASSIMGAAYPYDGVVLGGLSNATISCTYSFSHPVLASSITVDLDAFQPGDIFSVALDGKAYAFTDADVVQTPLPPSSASLWPVGQDTLVQQSGTMVLSAGAQYENGSAKVKVAANQWISALKLNMRVDDVSGGGVTRVCIDDAAPPPPPPSAVAAPVPAGLGAVGAASAGILGFAVFLARRRRSARQP